jgi:hypothetical protein
MKKKKRGFFVEKSPIGDTQFGDTSLHSN